jgi:exopolysaccharide biosynthesis protein
MKRFQRVYTLLFALALTAFSAYALLDTFVLTRVYATVDEAETPAAYAAETAASCAPETEALDASSAEQDAEPQTLSHRHGRGGKSRNTGEDSTAEETVTAAAEPAENTETGGAQITVTEYYEYGSAIYVADILLDDASALKTAFAQNSYGRNVTATTSAAASRVGAVLAINGDNYGSREKGYVIRNGVLYRSAAAKDQEDLVIYANGSFAIIREEEITAQELLDSGAVQVFSFGPGLIEDGSITVSANEEVDRAKASNPRTAIGIIGEGHLVFVVSDGRTSESEGLSLYELAEFMQRLGVQTAYNLDGGGSSTMVYEGQVVNQPTSGGAVKERAVTDIIYIA